MKVAIVRIGNSRGVRLPKAVLEQTGLTDEAELSVEDGRIVLSRPLQAARSGWAQAFAAAPAELSQEEQDWIEAPLTDER